MLQRVAACLATLLVVILALPPSVAAQTLTLGMQSRDFGVASDIVYQSACPTPRPPVKVDVNPQGDGRIKVTLTAGNGALSLVRFGQMANAHVTIPGSSQQYTSNQEVKPPTGATTFTFDVIVTAGAQSGQTPPATTVPMTIFDGCGANQPWQTFVGGGASANQSTASIADAQASEGNTGNTQVTFTIKLSVPSSQPVTYTYNTSNGTASAPGDFIAASGTVTFNPGETEKTVTVQVRGDFDDESDETFTITLSNPVNGGLGRATATARIVNDDSGPSASGDTYTASIGQQLTVAAPGVLSNDQNGSQAIQVISFGDLDAGGSVTSNSAGSTKTLSPGGSLTVRANGSFDFTPPTNAGATFSFRYRTQSLAGQSDATVIVNIQTGPTAVADPNYIATGSTELSVPQATGVLANDTRGTPQANVASFGTGSPTTVPAGTALNLGNGGSLTVQANGSFTFTAPSIVTGPFTFQYRITNPAGSSDATVTIDVRRGPAITITGGATPFLEGGSATVVDAGLTVTSPGGGNVDSATITITNLLDAGAETLAANPGATGIGVNYAAPTLTLTGSRPASDYEQVLRTVTYVNTAPSPNTTSRVIQFQGVASAQAGNQANKTISVGTVNDAPAGTDNSVSLSEDATYIFTVADFGFTDPNDTPVNTLQAVRITTLPAAGVLSNNGSAVTAGDVIPVATITGGQLTYTPAFGTSGSPYTTLTFQVQDNGGTAGGGVDLDQTPNTITVNVGGLNDAPSGTDKTVSTTEDTAYIFTVADFGFTDPNDTPPNALLAVTITTLPAAGSLTNNGLGVSAAQSIPVADIAGGLLRFTPAAGTSGTPYTTFTFQVQDNGGTADGGIDLDQTPNTITVNVGGLNDAPVGADKAVTTTEDVAYTFTVADFGFTDPNDTPPHNLLAVRITTLPTAGSLTNNAVAVVAGGSIPVADITGGLLKFTPALGASGTPYATFTFQVQDDGGTAGGGVDLDPTANTITVNVTAVNSPPAGTNGTVTALEDAVYTFVVADFGFTDPLDAPPNTLQAVTITTLPALGTLTNNGVGVTAGQSIPAADITGGLLRFTPPADASGTPYTTLTFQVHDNGGGTDLDLSPNTITVNVTPVNDAPAGTDNTVTTDEDVAHTFTAADFGFTDPLDTPPNTLQAVTITTLPVAGSLTRNNVAVTAGQSITLADLTGNLLKFTPAPNANGLAYASFTFQVQDNGGGTDLDLSPNTMTINVTSVIDDPTAVADPETVLEDSGLSTFSVLGNDTNPDGATMTIASVTQPTSGQASSAVAGGNTQVTYTPNANYCNSQVGGTADTFTYTLSPGGSVGTVTVTVTCVNDAPSFAILTSTHTTAEDAGLITVANFASSINDGDPESTQTLTFTLASTGTPTATFLTAPAISSTGTLTYQAAANSNGTATFNVTLADNGVPVETTAPQSITITVTAVNDKPTALAKNFTAQANMKINGLSGLLTGAADANDNGINGCTSTAFTVGTIGATTPAGGLISNLNTSAGTFDFDPPPGVTGNVTFNYTVVDTGCGSGGNQTSDPATITVNVAGPVVWFVDDSTVAGGTGTLNSPFQTLAQAAAVDGSGHRVFVYSGSYAGFTLNSSEWLIGQGVTGTDFDTIFSITPPAGTIARPSINGTRPALSGTVTMATSSVVRGLNISSGGSTGITGSGATGLTTGEVSVTTTTGTAVNFSGATTSTLSFTSVSANGATNGIILNNTSGSFTVTGTGGANSGGTIQNVADDAVKLTNANDVSLSDMSLTNSGESWVDATTVTGLTLTRISADLSFDHGILGSTVTNLVVSGGTYNRGAFRDGTNAVCNLNGFHLTNLLGTSTVTGATFTRSNTVQFRINNNAATNFAGTPDTLTVSGTNWNTHNVHPCHGDHLSVSADTGGNFRLVVNNSVGTNTFKTAGIAVQAAGAGSGKMDAQISAVTSGGGLFTDANTAGVTIEGTASSSVTFNVSNNTTLGTGSVGMTFNDFTSGTFSGTVDNNSITHVAGPGTDALQIVSHGDQPGSDGVATIAITNNTIVGNFQRGVRAQSAFGEGTLNITATGNNVHGTDPTATALRGMEFEVGGSGGGNTNQLCLNLANNNSSMDNGNAGYRLFHRAGYTFQLQNLTGSGTSEPNIVNWVQVVKDNDAFNGIDPGIVLVTGVANNFTTSAGCPTP